MKTPISFALAFAAILLMAPLGASASCYFVYSGGGQLIYRSTVSPVDLSKPISAGLASRFPGTHLTMVPDSSDCPDLLTSGEGRNSRLALASRTSANAFESPLFRNAGSALDSSVLGASPSGRIAACPIARSRPLNR